MAYLSAKAHGAVHQRNCVWPLQRSQNGWQRTSMAARAEAALRHLLRTPRGAFYADPNYGVSLYKYRTQAITVSDEAVILADIRRATQAYLPEVVVHSINLYKRSYEQRVELTVVWTLRGGQVQLDEQAATPRKLLMAI